MAEAPVSVLLLEDQHLVRAGMAALIHLAEPRAVVHEASSYAEALVVLEEQQIDLAFLDIDLRGDRNGIDLLEFIRSDEADPPLATRVVMLSGRDDKATVLACIDKGACGYIPKGTDAEDVFRRAIDTVLAGGVFLPARVLGRGGFSPAPTAEPPAVSAESLGLRGRPLEVLYYLCQGLPDKGIALKLGISENTVRKDHMQTVLRAFRVSRRTEVIVEVARRGIVVPAPGSAEAA